MTIALLDADVIVYRAAAAHTKDIDWGDGAEGLTINVPRAIDAAHYLVKKWIEFERVVSPILCFSDPDGLNFRKALLPSYKANRSAKPEAIGPVMEAMYSAYKTWSIPALEADDVMGILGTSPKNAGAVIVTIDKDLQTIPGRLLNPDKHKRPRMISLESADYFWMAQTLIGDSTDHYRGCPGVGPVGAEALLDPAMSLEELWIAVVGAFDNAGLSENDAVVQAQMSRILRHEDYDKHKGLIRAWHPNPKKVRWLSLSNVKERMPSVPSITAEEKSNPSTTRRRTGLVTVRAPSSSTSLGRRSKGTRSKTSRRRAGSSTGSSNASQRPAKANDR